MAYNMSSKQMYPYYEVLVLPENPEWDGQPLKLTIVPTHGENDELAASTDQLLWLEDLLTDLEVDLELTPEVSDVQVRKITSSVVTL